MERHLTSNAALQHRAACRPDNNTPEQSESVTASLLARSKRRTSATAFPASPDCDDPLASFQPYIHTAPRRNSITPEKQRAFIVTLAATGIVTQAARSIGASLEALYKLRHRTGAEGFAAAWDAAVERGISRLEDCALERAIAGEERPVVWDGQVVTTWKRYDTSLLMFLLRQRRAERYGSSAGRFSDLRPGHPVYDRLRAEWDAEAFAKANNPQAIAAVRESIHRKLEAMRAEVLARRAAEAEERQECDEMSLKFRELKERDDGDPVMSAWPDTKAHEWRETMQNNNNDRGQQNQQGGAGRQQGGSNQSGQQNQQDGGQKQQGGDRQQDGNRQDAGRQDSENQDSGRSDR